MANPIQQGLKPTQGRQELRTTPVPQWLIQYNKDWNLTRQWGRRLPWRAAMANPIQQGLKQFSLAFRRQLGRVPQWLIQYNKDWNVQSPSQTNWGRPAAMANPIQQGLKPPTAESPIAAGLAAMANPIQQGLKLSLCSPKKPAPMSRNG